MYVSIIGRGFFKHVKHKGMKTSTLSGRWEPHVTIAASASIRLVDEPTARLVDGNPRSESLAMICQ